jgi:hypothetical protein
VDPDAILKPVGPLPPRVYWLRRAGLLMLVVVLLAGTVKACSGGGGGTDRLGSEPQPSVTTSTPAPHTKPTRCSRDALDVTAGADAETYPAGVLPQLTAEVRNVSDAPCRLAVEQDSRIWTVVSGADQVWSTADCPHPGDRSLHRLGAGKAITYRVAWDRHRSEEGCATPGAEAQPGTYRLLVTIDRVKSEPVVFHLTG